MKTIQIETSSKSNFEQRFNLFAKKVAKMGLTKPTFSYGGIYQKEKLIIETSEGEEYRRILMLEVVDVDLNIDESYKMNGWELVSVVLFQDEVILPIDLGSVPPTELGLKYTKCDHCGGNHSARKKSFIVKNESGFKQVGSTCSKEFLGMSERLITNMQVMFTELVEIRFTDGSEDWENYSGRMGRDKSWLNKYNGIDLSKVMSVVIPEVSENGYEKQKFAQKPSLDWRGRQSYNHNGQPEYENDYSVQLNKETATINKITPKIEAGVEVPEIDFSDFIEYVNDLKLKTYTTTGYIKPEMMDGKIDYTKLIEEGFFQSVEFYQGFDSSLSNVVVSDTRVLWVSNIEDQYDRLVINSQTGCAAVLHYKTYEKEGVVEDFNFKLKQLVAQKMVMKKDISTLAAGYASFLKFKTTPETKFVGVVGEKEKLTLTITDTKTGNGQFGAWTLWTLTDVDGNVFTKFGAIGPKFSDSEEVKIGSVIKATFEIKEHKEFNMKKQTVLGRLSTYK